ncbi:Uncharacterized protein PHPALM_17062 [Phytophthora palmivora]|uniref:Reverse transcriptase domain-containing protein n=1 Tax=Phytophthora palmivora TaxID=4796 RepID=A0A2P4XN63_9STRA|nr:Uncharacterized protein PHPALM_17062 [Phytophthora palmivora]
MGDFNNKLVEFGWEYENRESRCTDLEVATGAIFSILADRASRRMPRDIIIHDASESVHTATCSTGMYGCSAIFQATIEQCIEELLHRRLLVWIGDMLLFANDVQTYLAKLERLFELLDSFGFKLSVKKSRLFKREAQVHVMILNRFERCRTFRTQERLASYDNSCAHQIECVAA